MRLLVITRSAWRNDNNTGNTLSDIFSDFDGEIYSLCFRDDSPENALSRKNFAVSESQILKHFKSHDNAVGRENSACNKNSQKSDLYSIVKKRGFGTVSLLFLRELLWNTNVWKNANLVSYIKKVKPDVIFMPVFNCYYPHKVLRYIHKFTNAKIVLFHSDDNYSLKKFSLNPFFWIYRFGLRRNIRKSVEISSKNYVISELQKKEYEKLLNVECSLLTKSVNSDICFEKKEFENFPLELVYTGNLSVGRWKTLALISNALKDINKNGVRAVLKIYSFTELSDYQKKLISDGVNSFFEGGISFEQVKCVQKNADVLVYGECFDFKEKLIVRQSFSTKIVDYLSCGRPIFAVGPSGVASIDYFAENNSAVTAVDKESVCVQLKKLVDDKNLRDKYAKKAYETAINNHNSQMIKTKFYEDLKNLLIDA